MTEAFGQPDAKPAGHTACSKDQCTLGEGPARKLGSSHGSPKRYKFFTGCYRPLSRCAAHGGLQPDTPIRPTRRTTSADGETPQSDVTKMSSALTRTPQKNITIKKRLTTLALVIALMTGSVAQLAVLLYRGALIIVVSSLSFASENGLVASEQDRLQQQTIKTAMQ